MSVVESDDYGPELHVEAVTPQPRLAERRPSFGTSRAWLGRLFRGAAKRPGAVLAVLFVLVFVLCAVAPALVAPYNPNDIIVVDKLQGPTWAHLFGSDNLGRDLLSRITYACAPSALAMVVAVGIGAAGGLSLGVVSGFLGGWIDSVIMRAVDVMLAIPALLLALAIVTAIGFGTVHVAIAVGIGIIPGFARITRAQVLRVRNLPYVEAARTSGATLNRVLWRHVLPNSWQPVLVLVVLDFGTAILAIAALSFLGFGPQPPSTDLGALVADGRDYLQTSPWLAILPGVVAVLLVFSLNHLALTLEKVER